MAAAPALIPRNLLLNASLFHFPVDGGLILARPDVNGLYLLNPSAALLWHERLRGASTIEAAHVFHAKFGIPLDQAENDIEATLTLWSQGLLAPSIFPSPPPIAPAADSQAVVINCGLNGKRFQVSVDPGALIDEIAPRLAHLAASFPSPDFTFTVTQTEERVFVSLDGVCLGDAELTSGARIILLQEMTRLCHPGRDPQIMFHAGACGDASGCVLLAGATHSGKSTLCAALMSAGFLCYSDDTAIIDHDFRVVGMPFPLMLREGSWSVIGSHFPDIQQAPTYNRWGIDVRFLASNLPGNSSPTAPAKALLFVEYRANANTALEPITTFDALVALEQSGFWVEHQQASIGAFLDWLGNLPKFRFTYSDLDEATAVVRRILHQREDFKT